MICTGQCEGCALKKGASANLEPDNRLRGIFAALGGYVFACHESLGWTPDKDGYPGGKHKIDQDLAILCSRPAIIRAGADSERLRLQVEGTRRAMRVCGGWKAAVARLKADGWFSNPTFRYIRRHYAKTAARDIEKLTHGNRAEQKVALRSIEQMTKWFVREAKDAKISIGWLLE